MARPNPRLPIDNQLFGQQLGPNWKAIRLLGAGTNGIVALYAYHGQPQTAPPVSQIAIKQHLSTGLANPLAEHNFLETLNKCQSKHILRQYRHAATLELPSSFGERTFQIALYLQYCPGGDLKVLMDPAAAMPGAERKPLILEEDLWDMFYCLSLAVSVMARGTEDVSSRPVLHGLDSTLDFVHHDIKLDNVFIGNRDPGHERYPALVLGDFGAAQCQFKIATRAQQAEVLNRGAPGWAAPENKEGHKMQFPKKGSCSNIFQIGLLMHALIHRLDRLPAIFPPRPWRPPYSDLRYTNKLTYGTSLFSAPWRDLYSATLRELVMHCLMYEPMQRVGVEELQRRVENGRRASREARRWLGVFDGVDGAPGRLFGNIPMMSGEWIPEPLGRT